MKIAISILVISAAILSWKFQSENLDKDEQMAALPIPQKDSIIEFTLSSVGDLMCHSTQYKYAQVGSDTFDFIPCFQYIEPYLQQADLLLGNLETTFGGNAIPYSGYPRFNTPDDYLTALKKVGFDFIITANNHSNDTDEKGILRTIQKLDEKQIAHTGTFTSKQDRDSIRIVDIKGIRIGIISYTFSTNGIDISPQKPWLVNYMDSTLIKKDILKARNVGAEIVIVFFHFGNEYERMPGIYQKQFVDWSIENGADIIIGSHPHVVQPATYFKTNHARLDSGFVAYSLGNFFSNQKDNYTDEGIIMNIHLQKNLISGGMKIIKTDYVPTWVYRGVNEEKKLHIIFPVIDYQKYQSLEFISNVELQEMKNAQDNTKSIMQKLSPFVLQTKY